MVVKADAQAYLQLRGISKHFGGIAALEDVDLDVREGEVLGLLGDNGAGKSTLIKTIAGVHQPNEGTIYCRGMQVRITSPDKAHELGIETVFQDLALIPNLAVADN